MLPAQSSTVGIISSGNPLSLVASRRAHRHVSPSVILRIRGSLFCTGRFCSLPRLHLAVLLLVCFSFFAGFISRPSGASCSCEGLLPPLARLWRPALAFASSGLLRFFLLRLGFVRACPAPPPFRPVPSSQSQQTRAQQSLYQKPLTFQVMKSHSFPHVTSALPPIPGSTSDAASALPRCRSPLPPASSTVFP